MKKVFFYTQQKVILSSSLKWQIIWPELFWIHRNKLKIKVGKKTLYVSNANSHVLNDATFHFFPNTSLKTKRTIDIFILSSNITYSLFKLVSWLWGLVIEKKNLKFTLLFLLFFSSIFHIHTFLVCGVRSHHRGYVSPTCSSMRVLLVLSYLYLLTYFRSTTTNVLLLLLLYIYFFITINNQKFQVYTN